MPKSLQNAPSKVNTGFKPEGYARFQTDNLTIIDKDKKEIAFSPNLAQEDLMNHLRNYYNVLILKARKMGFSSEALAIAVAKFILGRNERCVTVSFDKSAAEGQLARAKHFIRSYERITGQKLPLKYNSKNELVYEAINEKGEVLYVNSLKIGSAKSTSFGRGDDITFLHITEVAFADDVRQLLAAAGEALVKGAHTILETTANGYNSYKQFWDETLLNKTGFAALFYSPEWEYDAAYLKDREQKLGKLYKQEYPMTPGEAFLTTGDTYFDQEAMSEYYDRAQEPDEKLSDPGFRRYRKLRNREFIVCFADTAVGGGDWCAAQFISKTNLDVPIVFHSSEMASEMTPQLHAELERIHDETGVVPVVAYERNNGGAFEMERLARLNKNGKYRIYQQKSNIGTTEITQENIKLGWDTNTATRPKMLQDIKEAIDNQLVKVYDKPTIIEMLGFIIVPRSSGWKAQAAAGGHDDLVMALAGAYQLFQTEAIPQPEQYFEQEQQVDLTV